MAETSSEQGDFVVTTTTLDEDMCRRLLGRSRFGRVAFIDDAGAPSALPVNCSVWGGDVVFRTNTGSPLHRLGDGRVVAFETDHIDRVAESGWSVLVRGAAHRVESSGEIAALAELDVHPWAAGERDQWIRIETTEVAGRMIDRHRVVRDDERVPYMPPD